MVGLAALVVGPATVPHQSLSAQLGPALILEDSVILRETDDHYVGQPVSLIPVGDGSFLIADGFSNSVLHFDSEGRYNKTFGRKGRDRGEFAFVSSAGFVARDLVGIGDDHAHELELFELGSGRHIGAVAVSPSALVDEYVVRGDTLWFAGINTEGWTSVGLTTLNEVVSAASSANEDGFVLSPDLLGAPRVYSENEVVMGVLPKVSLDAFEDRLLAGFAASPRLLVANSYGAVLDSVEMPVARRRGLLSDDDLHALKPGPEVTGIFGQVSYLVKVSHTSNGFINTVHQESNYDPATRQMRGTFFVSSARVDGEQPCPDTLVPTSDAGLPELTLEGDRLHVLDQRLGDRGVRTVIRTFRIDPVNCTGGIVGAEG
ncbi:MAG: hypothetical protein OXK77_18365 [Gemmatimonadota bacterium]|nr:hypothetical protein [Gemmatimonadota bacterium]MDE2863864.1 hypothetical protein [Gemmatimonadota bacterium]